MQKIRRTTWHYPFLLICLFALMNSLKVTMYHGLLSSNLYWNAKHLGTAMAFDFEQQLYRNFAIVLVVFIMASYSRAALPTFYLLQLTFVSVNLLYYFYSHSYIHFNQIATLVSEGLQASRSVLSTLRPQLVLLYLDVPILVYFIVRNRQFRTAVRGFPSWLNLSCLSLGLLAVAAMHFENIIDDTKLKTFYGEKRIVAKYGIAANLMADFLATRDHGRIAESIVPGPEMAVRPYGAKTDVVVIQVESLNANVLRFRHQGRPVMPYLDSLSRHSLYFSKTLSYHMAGGTSDAEFAILNSLEPHSSMPAFSLRNYGFPNSVAHVFKSRGYSTVALHGNTCEFFNRCKAFKEMGFDRFIDIQDMGETPVVWGAPDRALFAHALERIFAERGRFFYYILTMSSHAPFSYVDKFFQSDHYGEGLTAVEAGYLKSMEYVDREIGHFISNVLSSRPKTTVVVVGDHTVEINGSVYTSESARFQQEGSLVEFVPLLIATPECAASEVNRYAASFLDIAPTLLSAAGVSCSYRSHGQSLFEPLGDDTIPYGSLRCSRSKICAFSVMLEGSTRGAPMPVGARSAVTTRVRSR